MFPMMYPSVPMPSPVMYGSRPYSGRRTYRRRNYGSRYTRTMTYRQKRKFYACARKSGSACAKKAKELPYKLVADPDNPIIIRKVPREGYQAVYTLPKRRLYFRKIKPTNGNRNNADDGASVGGQSAAGTVYTTGTTTETVRGTKKRVQLDPNDVVYS